MTDIVTLEVKDHIGFVTLNRPDKYNALSIEMIEKIIETGRVVEAKEAAELGMVTRVVDNPLSEATEMARLIASKSPDAISRDKRLLESAWRAGPAKGLIIEETLQREIIATPNQIEAIMAVFENRDPKFSDRS